MSKENKPKLQIRNSTAEFLVFTKQADEEGIEVRVAEETVWLTQKLMGQLFEVDVRTVSEHLGNIFANGELTEAAVIRKFRITATDGKNYLTNFYNLDAIIAVGFRVNSTRATQFRQWAIGVLRDFAIRGLGLAPQPPLLPSNPLPPQKFHIHFQWMYVHINNYCNFAAFSLTN